MIQSRTLALALAISVFAGDAPAQTVDLVLAAKLELNVQTSAAQVALAPGLPYGIDLNVEGSDIDLLPAPSVAGPISNPEPGHNGGVLGYNLDDESWRYGFPNFGDWGTATRTELDALFGSGTYTFSIAGASYSVDLSGDLYPANAPVHTLSGGQWAGGVYVLAADQALSITTSAYAEYGSHVEDAISLDIYGSDYEDELIVFHSTTAQNFLSLVVPANTLTPGNTYTVEAGFLAASDFDTTVPGLPGALVAATYDRSTLLTVEVVGPSIGTLYCSPANANSSGGPAYLTARGSSLIADNDLSFEVVGLPTSQFGYFLMSENQATIPVSNGVLCLGGPQFRFNQFILNSGATGTMSFSPHLSAGLPGGVALQAGDTWNFTLWFRDGQNSNFSDAVSIGFQ